MCSWIWDMDWITFMEEEKKFLESLKEENKRENNILKEVTETIKENKTDVIKIISSNER